jgi:hypothetical protein
VVQLHAFHAEDVLAGELQRIVFDRIKTDSTHLRGSIFLSFLSIIHFAISLAELNVRSSQRHAVRLVLTPGTSLAFSRAVVHALALPAPQIAVLLLGAITGSDECTIFNGLNHGSHGEC